MRVSTEIAVFLMVFFGGAALINNWGVDSVRAGRASAKTGVATPKPEDFELSKTEIVDSLVTREVCLDGLVFRKTTDRNGNGGLVQVFIPHGGNSVPKTCR